MNPEGQDFRSSLEAAARGDAGAQARLLPLVYEELRRIAASYLFAERPGHTLEPTDLVHEAYKRLAGLSRIEWQGKTHFRALAAMQMRRILVDHARRHAAGKRDAGLRVTLGDDIAPVAGTTIDVLALDEALETLSKEYPRAGRVVELRFFAGLDIDEVAHVLAVHPNTVKNDWRFARAWLFRALTA